MRHHILFVLLISSIACYAQDFSAYERQYFNAPELNLPYRYLRPDNFDSTKKYPLVVFLHGAHEKGSDNESQLNIGGRFFLRDSIRKNYPAFVLFAQCPLLDVWAYFETKTDPTTDTITEINFPFNKKPTEVSSVLMKLLDSLVHSDKIDLSRVYIGGLSQGGMGVLDFIERYPKFFAAAFCICGAGNVSVAKNFAGKTSLWLFHGDADNVIPVRFSRDYFKRLQKLKGDVLYTEYQGVKHNSWVNAFNEPALLYWLFSKRKYD
jgi:predicted peptidase